MSDQLRRLTLIFQEPDSQLNRETLEELVELQMRKITELSKENEALKEYDGLPSAAAQYVHAINAIADLRKWNKEATIQLSQAEETINDQAATIERLKRDNETLKAYRMDSEDEIDKLEGQEVQEAENLQQFPARPTETHQEPTINETIRSHLKTLIGLEESQGIPSQVYRRVRRIDELLRKVGRYSGPSLELLAVIVDDWNTMGRD